MWLNRGHQAVWEELECHLRSAVPGFRSLKVKPHGGPGAVIGGWCEAGVDAELTLANLSDRTLRFLAFGYVVTQGRAIQAADPGDIDLQTFRSYLHTFGLDTGTSRSPQRRTT